MVTGPRSLTWGGMTGSWVLATWLGQVSWQPECFRVQLVYMSEDMDGHSHATNRRAELSSPDFQSHAPRGTSQGYLMGVAGTP